MRHRSPLPLLICLLVLSAVYRLWLGGHYFGWEESDYGNLAMANGVLESGFRHYDMNHLPMYYGLSALVLALVDDVVVATRAVSLIAGCLTVALAAGLADRLLGRWEAWAVGLLCCFQPELALYSASSLREPVYAAAVMATLVALQRERSGRASVFAGVAFLTRMDALLALGPALLLHGMGRSPRWRRAAWALGPLLVAVLGWAAYCSQVHGTWAFWGHSVSVNVETGGAEEGPGWVWVMEGLHVVGALVLDMLPSRMGWAAWLGMIFGFVSLRWRGHSGLRTVAVAALGLLAFWLGIAFVAQHSPEHNLYWKWLHAVLPPLFILAVAGLSRAVKRLTAVGGLPPVILVGALLCAQTAWAFQLETRRQVDLSVQLYKPQLDIARALEAQATPGQAMLVDNIPGCWINRRPHSLQLHSWFDVPVPPADRQAFGEWVAREQLSHVLWFEEEWTQAPVIAPWLTRFERHELGPVQLIPEQQERAYGWVLYRVEVLSR